MKKIKNIKPTDIDLYIKYSCPNKKCNNDHWTTLKESKTKDFIIVCDCGYIIKPKQIDKICIKYKKKTISTNKNKNNTKNQTTIPADLLEKSVKTMMGLGYSKEESTTMIMAYYNHNPINDCMMLVKNTIAVSTIGDYNE